jgi:hypothetical protein
MDGQLVGLLHQLHRRTDGRGHGGEEFLRSQPMSELTHRQASAAPTGARKKMLDDLVERLSSVSVR